MKRLYNLGIYPEWWKLEPMDADAVAGDRRADRRARPAIAAASCCSGSSAGIETLAKGFARCARQRDVPRLRRRPHDLPGAARAWLAGAIDDAALKRAVRANFEALIDAWQDARADDGGGSWTNAAAMRGRHDGTVRLTMAQALVRYLAALRIDGEDAEVPLFGGVFAIFGHGNVAGIGEALYRASRRAADVSRAQRAGDGARGDRLREGAHAPPDDGVHDVDRAGRHELVTAAALAHVNRLPVLLLPGDIFVTRAPDPVLQQVEDFQDGTVSANDCFRPVSRYFDRIAHPAQLLTALPRAMRVLTDPGAVRAGDARAAAGRAGDGVRLSRRSSSRRAPVRFDGPPPIAAELDAAASACCDARSGR